MIGQSLTSDIIHCQCVCVAEVLFISLLASMTAKKALTWYLEIKFCWILLNLCSFQVGKWRGLENKKRGSGFSQSCIEGQTDGQVTGAGSGISGDKTERFPSGNCCNFDSSSSRVRILIATSIYMAGWCSHSLPLQSLCVLLLFFAPLFCIFHHGHFA